MTIAASWIRKVNNCEELVFISDSRLCGGQRWDECPKITTLPGNNYAMAFAGDADYACLGCEYCHGKGEGQCVQKDDMGQIIDAYKWADMLVFASPIYYSEMTAQLHAAIQRVYSIGKPAAAKAALLLSTATGQTEPVEAYFKQLTGFLGMENCGVCKAVGEENKSEEKMAQIKAWAATL